jgi:hypothetical protein
VRHKRSAGPSALATLVPLGGHQVHKMVKFNWVRLF